VTAAKQPLPPQLIAALPLAVVALALGHAAAWPYGLAFMAIVAVVSAIGARWDVDAGRQALTSAIGAGAGYVITSFAYEPDPGRLTDGWAKLCAAALLAAAARTLLTTPRGGYAATLALAFAGLTFAGKTPNAAYPGYVVAFLLSGVWGLGVSRRGASLAPAPRRFWMGALVILAAALLGVGTTSGLRQLHAWARNRTRFTSVNWQPRVGFSDRMDLGALDGLLDSDRRVLRVRGGQVDYLRGVVLDLYERGSWTPSDASRRQLEERLDGTPDAQAVEISAIAPQLSRFFLPLEAAKLRTEPGLVLVDDLGAVRPGARRAQTGARFELGPRSSATLAAPRPSDLHIPRRLRPRLEALAKRWTAGAQGDAAKLGAIERRLRSDYGYSRSFRRQIGIDPVLEFLFRRKRGHCEYFASALALLGRAAGVPTRVVMGYRVSEKSPFGYYVVRERNAHSWVEAWLPGEGWSTRDATPLDAQPNNREQVAGYLASSLDALGVAYDEATEWLSARSLAETSAAWLLGCVVLAVIVARGVRRRGRQARLGDDEALLPFMRPLLAALARDGHPRRPDEPLERLAARLPEDEPARLLLRYSALRYGGIGDADSLARDVGASLAARRAGSRAGAHRANRR
jgi:transglutaminase-like putative cysteine protease